MPDFWLQKALPSSVLDPPPAKAKRSPQKRKRRVDNEEGLGLATGSGKKHPKSQERLESSIDPSSLSPTARARDFPPQEAVRTSGPIDLLSDSEGEGLDIFEKIQFHTSPAAIAPSSSHKTPRGDQATHITRGLRGSNIIHLESGTEDSEDDVQLKEAIHLSLKDPDIQIMTPHSIVSSPKQGHDAIGSIDLGSYTGCLFSGVPEESSGPTHISTFPFHPLNATVNVQRSQGQKQSLTQKYIPKSNDTPTDFRNRCPNRSIPSPGSSALASPLPKGSRHVTFARNERTCETTTERTHSKSTELIAPHQSCGPLSELRNSEQLRAARLRHFIGREQRNVASPSHNPISNIQDAVLSATQRTHNATRSNGFEKNSGIECIDLTGD